MLSLLVSEARIGLEFYEVQFLSIALPFVWNLFMVQCSKHLNINFLLAAKSLLCYGDSYLNQLGLREVWYKDSYINLNRIKIPISF